ncbi:MAG: hypothetical protein PHS02_03150 [Candidatus ainarchaeum sp.]|nr:hypothetical protein [Candidatus ainarchaeum sp.]
MLMNNGKRVVGQQVQIDLRRDGALGKLDAMAFSEFRTLGEWKKLELLTDAYEQKRRYLKERYHYERTEFDLETRSAMEKMRRTRKEWKRIRPTFEKKLKRYEEKIENLVKQKEELPKEERRKERVDRYLEGPHENYHLIHLNYHLIHLQWGRPPLPFDVFIDDFREGDIQKLKRTLDTVLNAYYHENFPRRYPTINTLLDTPPIPTIAREILQIIGEIGNEEDLFDLKKYRPPEPYERTYEGVKAERIYYAAGGYIKAAIKQIEARLGKKHEAEKPVEEEKKPQRDPGCLPGPEH